jgi:hypothetical protein
MDTRELMNIIAPNIEVTDEFGYWFSGIVDGEACFVLDIRKGATNTLERKVGMKIEVRSDDRSILEYITENIGGSVSYKKQNRNSVWLMQQASQCATTLVPLFDKYKLHSKKAKEFIIWREMVLRHFQLQLINRNQIRTDKLNDDFYEAERKIKEIRNYE